jgi:hypothetical protein
MKGWRFWLRFWLGMLLIFLGCMGLIYLAGDWFGRHMLDGLRLD